MQDVGENGEDRGHAGGTVEEIRAHGRHDKHGKFLPGNAARFVNGLRMRDDSVPAALTELHRERVDELERDLAGDLGAIQRSAVAEWSRLSLLCEALGRNLMEHGTHTGKGRTRATLTAYLAVLDRLHRFSTMLGLERRARPIPSLSETLSRLRAEEPAPSNGSYPRDPETGVFVASEEPAGDGVIVGLTDAAAPDPDSREVEPETAPPGNFSEHAT